jgi:hypothetical protein
VGRPDRFTRANTPSQQLDPLKLDVRPRSGRLAIPGRRPVIMAACVEEVAAVRDGLGRQGVADWLVERPDAPTTVEADALPRRRLHHGRDHPAARGARRRPSSAPTRGSTTPAGTPGRAGAQKPWRRRCCAWTPSPLIRSRRCRRSTVTGGDSDSIAAVTGAIFGALHDSPGPPTGVHAWSPAIGAGSAKPSAIGSRPEARAAATALAPSPVGGPRLDFDEPLGREQERSHRPPAVVRQRRSPPAGITARSGRFYGGDVAELRPDATMVAPSWPP